MEDEQDEITQLFEQVAGDLGKLEKALRKHEENSKVCLPLYNIRWGVKQLKEFYESGQTVCDKQTRYEKYLDQQEAV